jgi:L-malate glycosyltransferase
MKIGIVCYPTFGGSGVVATELGKALAMKGHEIHFISYSQPVRLIQGMENVFFHEVNVSSYPLFDYPPYELVLASKLVDVVRFEKLDLLHVHYAIPHASAAYMAARILAAEGIRIPYVTTLHGTDITLVGRDASFEPVITFAINESSAVTAVSESLAADTRSYFKVRKEIQVIPNFVCREDYAREPNERQRRHLAPGGEKILVHVSNFRKVKRVEDVVRVFAGVRSKMPARLLLIGDGPERSGIEKLCREMDTCNDIRFLGKVTDPVPFLKISDLFLLTSETESFGLAALEAMACGVPVISTNTGGIPEVNIHGETGFLSGVGEVKEMTANALSLLGNDELLRKFKANALKRADAFEIGKILPLYEKLYTRLLS